MNEKLSTKDRILTASIDLFSKNGYKAVTTKQIAKTASVNEVTLFRYFGSKQKLLEEAMDTFYLEIEIKKIFDEKIIWDLEKDLMMISKITNNFMNQNRKIIQITMNSYCGMDEKEHDFGNFPQTLKGLLTEYFLEMQKRGKVIEENPEGQAITFMFSNFGNFMSSEVVKDKITTMSTEDFIKSSIKIFVRGLTT